MWKVGAGQALATMRMDALDFSIIVSCRFTYGEALGRAELSGDVSLVKDALKNLLILF